MEKKEIFNTIIATLGTLFTWLFGVWDIAISILVLFMFLDHITGVVRGYINKELSSNVGFKGLARKAVIFIILIVAVALDRLVNNGTWVFRTLVAYFYICNEGLSIVENSVALGMPVPEKLKEVLLQLKEGNKKEIKEE